MTLEGSLASLLESTSDAIPRTLLEQAIDKESVSALGIAFTIVTSDPLRCRVVPSVDEEFADRLFLVYLPKCIQTPQESEWCEPPHLAGHSICSWFQHLWKTYGENDGRLTRWKEVLAMLYRDGDDKMRRVVIDSVLEHLFTGSEMLKVFSDWRRDVVLGRAYKEALEQSSRIECDGAI